MAKHAFYLYGGRVISNLIELAEALESVEEEIFKHHVTQEKNDFAEWIEHSADNPSLALKIRGFTTPLEIKEAIQEEIRSAETQKQGILKKPEHAKAEDTQATHAERQGMHEFILKEFVFGALIGFILGILIMAVLVYTGIIY